METEIQKLFENLCDNIRSIYSYFVNNCSLDVPNIKLINSLFFTFNQFICYFNKLIEILQDIVPQNTCAYYQHNNHICTLKNTHCYYKCSSFKL